MSTFKGDIIDAPGGISSLPTQTGSAVFPFDFSASPQLSIVNDATATPFGNANNFSGMFIINDPSVTGQTAMFLVGGSSTVVIASQTGTLYSTTQGTASKVNVYPNSGVITIENKSGSTIGFRVFAIRMRDSG